MSRLKPNAEWRIPEEYTWEHAALEVMMDIREELRKLNRLLHCENFQDIPRTLRYIRSNTAKPRKVKTT